MSRPVVHCLAGSARFQDMMVPIVLCNRLFVDEATSDDGAVTCRDCKRRMKAQREAQP